MNEKNSQSRWRSWALWLSIAAALWTIASEFGWTEAIGIGESTFKTVVDSIGVILVGFGIVNDPTSKDSL